MRKDIAGPETESTMPMWEGLEGVVREKAQEFIQQIMEEEVTELLGREKSERRSTVDSAEGYRNGYGKARRLSMSSGTITVRRPRVRGLEERFESRVLPLFARRTKEEVRMSRRRHTPEQIITALREAEVGLANGKTVAMVSRELGISEQTYYRWRQEFGGMKVDQARRFKELEKENARLKRAVANLTVDKLILEEATKGNF